MIGFVVIEYGDDRNEYYAFDSREAANKKFIELVKDWLATHESYEPIEYTQNDLEKLAKDMFFVDGGKLYVEMTRCRIEVRHD